jgi:hypothetical protein
MNGDFSSIYNHHERAVAEMVRSMVPRYAQPQLINEDMLADIACVALNRLPPRYIRHEVDFAFYLTDKERIENERAIGEAVAFAFEFVQARSAMKARR